MVRDRTIASTVGMIAGMIIVTGSALAAGIELFPALALSLIGLAFGGWLAERHHLKRKSSESRDGARAA